ncbi:MAG: hypothetical protein PVSMB11_12190 [Desulfuromonadaceae bacterium]
MRPLIRISAVFAATSLLILPARVLAHSGRATMPMIGVKILSPAPGTVIHANAISVQSTFTNWKLNCALAGKANKHGIGHYHIFLDGGLVNMFCGDTASVSLQNSAAGLHSLMVVPADNNHSDMMYMKEAKTVKFTYRPTNPLATIKLANLGKPSISITSPANGQTVSGTFPVTISVQNFRLSCALYGKQNLKGYGHWHLNHDSMMGPMMGMATMLGMSCAHSFQASTAGLKPGRHTFFAILEDNQHAPLMPDVFAKVTVNVK